MYGPFSWLLNPPLWLRWILAFAVAAALLIGLIEWVSHHNGNGLATVGPKAEARANREAEIVVSQDQAPHVATIGRGPRRRAVVRTIRAAMIVRINAGEAGAPLQSVTCHEVGAQAGELGYRCIADSAGVQYPYQAVLERATRRLTFCKHDAPPVPSQNIPVSPRCRLST